MKLIFHLAWSYVRHCHARMILTSLAMIAAAAMVVWVVSSYDAMLGQFGDFASKSLGRYQLVLLPQNNASPMLASSGPPPTLSAELIDQLRTDPSVLSVETMMRLPAGIRAPSPDGVPAMTAPLGTPPSAAAASQPAGGRRGRGFAPPGGPPMISLIATSATLPPFELIDGSWLDLQHPDRLEGVIGKNAAETLKVHVGDTVTARTRGGDSIPLKLIGIMDQPVPSGGRAGGRGMGPVPGPATPAIFVPMALAEQIIGGQLRVSFAGLTLKSGVDAQQFRDQWAPRLAAATPPAMLESPDDIKGDLQEGMSANAARNQAYAATGIALLAAVFIIFATLSMGVSERIRQFAILRAVALTRFQIGCLVVIDSLFLALIGWGGGLLAGWGLLAAMAKIKPAFFTGGASLGMWCIILSGVCAVGGGLCASVIPAWRAARVRPLDAMAPTAPVRRRWPLWSVVIGALLIIVNPLLTFVVPITDEWRYAVASAVGCTSMALGFILLTPLAVLVAERLLAPLVATALGLEPSLLHSQLTANLWRTVGTAAALSVGLGLFVALQTWGYTMLKPFVPGPWVPDATIAFMPGGLSDDQVEAVRHAPGIISDQCQPLAVEQARLAEDITGARAHASVTRQDNVIMIGLNPAAAFGGKSPLVKAEFVEGNPEEIIAKLKSGPFCVVPDHFLRATGLHVGDKFKMLAANASDAPVEYTIAGVVSLPGWHWITKFCGVRMVTYRSAAMVFADFAAVRRDFKLSTVRFFWTNLQPGATAESVAQSMQAIAAKALGRNVEIADFGFPPTGFDYPPQVRVTTAAEIRERINTRADGMIWGMVQLPLVTLAVASLGVVNAVMASVRARRWEFGVLRAVGFTTSSLVRLVLAESLLIGLVACLTSLGFGIMAGWCGTGISQYVSFFGGLNPSLVVPWAKLSQGLGMAIAFCALAAFWPAVRTGLTEPLELLQDGRAAL